jgi:hypothetical protein
MESVDPVNIILTATGGRFRKGEGYLSCDDCRGYYELQRGESPEDFCEQCECGGNLTFTPLIESYSPLDNGVRDYLAVNSNPVQELEDLDLLEMEDDKKEKIEDYPIKVKMARELPLGPVFLIIFFLVSIVSFWILCLLIGYDPMILIMNF